MRWRADILSFVFYFSLLIKRKVISLFQDTDRGQQRAVCLIHGVIIRNAQLPTCLSLKYHGTELIVINILNTYVYLKFLRKTQITQAGVLHPKSRSLVLKRTSVFCPFSCSVKVQHILRPYFPIYFIMNVMSLQDSLWNNICRFQCVPLPLLWRTPIFRMFWIYSLVFSQILWPASMLPSRINLSRVCTVTSV